jgi:hypothetical protein
MSRRDPVVGGGLVGNATACDLDPSQYGLNDEYEDNGAHQTTANVHCAFLSDTISQRRLLGVLVNSDHFVDGPTSNMR